MIRLLVTARLLKSLGNPAQNAMKFFATSQLLAPAECAEEKPFGGGFGLIFDPTAV
jgi:hypothetical protein